MKFRICLPRGSFVYRKILGQVSEGQMAAAFLPICLDSHWQFVIKFKQSKLDCSEIVVSSVTVQPILNADFSIIQRHLVISLGLMKIINSYLIAVLWKWKVLQISAPLGGTTWFHSSFFLSMLILAEECIKIHVNFFLLEEMLIIKMVIHVTFS